MLIDLDDFRIMAAIYFIVCVYVYAYEGLYISEMNETSGAKDGRKELGIFCFFKVLAVPVKQNRVI